MKLASDNNLRGIWQANGPQTAMWSENVTCSLVFGANSYDETKHYM